MEWLHQGCESELSADFLNFGANNFPFKIPFKKCIKIVFLSLWCRDPVLELQFLAIARSSIVFCNSVSADRIVVAASRLLGAAAACVILLSFAAEDRKSYWNGCIKAAKVNCQQIFSILAVIIFLLKFLLKSASKSSFCRFGVEIRFWSCNFLPLHVVLLCFATHSADRIVVAASRLLGAAAACVILLSFAAEDRKSYWNGCIKATKVIC